MKRVKNFTFPKVLINQINECSKGFFLVAVNQDDQFEIYQCLDNPVLNLAMINFLEVYSTAAQQNIRDKTIEQLGGVDEDPEA